MANLSTILSNKSQRCGHCQGTGKILKDYPIHQGPRGAFNVISVKELCPVCKGHGFIKRSKEE